MNPRNGKKARILLLGPQLDAVSGVSTHLNQLFRSELGEEFDLDHFQVGSEGRRESRLRKLMRLASGPILLAARILRDRPGIVHINASLDHKSFPRDATNLLVSKALRRRIIFQIHGGELPTAFCSNSVLRKHLLTWVLGTADIVVLLARSEIAAYSEFAPAARVQIIPNATTVGPLGESTDKSFSGPLRLVYVGRLVPTKGVADCLAAAQRLKDAGREFTLTIAGTGPQEGELRLQAETLVEDRLVHFVGALHGEAKDKLWRESHVFLFPTFHLEGLPYALLEAMAAGAVPITTRVGAHPDVMGDGVHGLFVPPADPAALYDAIARLDDDRQLLASMSHMSGERIRDRYTVNRLGSDFSGVYRSLIPTGDQDS